MNLIFKKTKLKLIIAHCIYRIVYFFLRKNEIWVIRGKIKYELDISEGIDLSIFLFGSFQKSVTSIIKFISIHQPIIFDIGANVGSMSLSWAKYNKTALIYAFEPTDNAYKKLIKNIALNNQLSTQIIAEKLYLDDKEEGVTNHELYSSWKIDKQYRSSHSIHGGQKQAASSVFSTTIDSYCINKKINKLDLIKIDTEGNELNILRGGTVTLQTLKPIIIFEVGIYLMNEQNIIFKEYYDFFDRIQYKILSFNLKYQITPDNYKRMIPFNYTTELVAMPNKIDNEK